MKIGFENASGSDDCRIVCSVTRSRTELHGLVWSLSFACVFRRLSGHSATISLEYM